MKIKVREATATFSTRGQIVIPHRIRRDLGIEDGTRALIEKQGAAILIRPVTRELIRSFRGCLKSRPGEKKATQELLEERAAELRKEEARFEKHRS